MELHAACADVSDELCDVQELFDALQLRLSRLELTRADYDAHYAAAEEKRDKIVARTPHFWLRALISHPALGMFITGSDCARLVALQRVSCVRHDGNDFDIVFTFTNNPYFENHSLIKTYRTHDWRGLCVGADCIRWKVGMRPREDVGIQLAHFGMMPGSFFDWFSTPGDCRLLGPLIRDGVLPHAIPLFHGSWQPNDEFFDDTDSDLSSLGEQS